MANNTHLERRLGRIPDRSMRWLRLHQAHATPLRKSSFEPVTFGALIPFELAQTREGNRGTGIEAAAGAG